MNQPASSSISSLMTDVSVQDPPSAPRRAVLLTGATGCLGREVLLRLLKRPQDDLRLLVRRASRGVARVEAMRRYLEASGADMKSTRIVLVVGDLLQPRLGLSPSGFRALQREVTHIVHAAAATDLAQGWLAAYRANVVGARRVAAFGAGAPSLRRFVQVSTAYAEMQETATDARLPALNAYERSKQQAERVVATLIDKARLRVVRPSILIGRSGDGWIAGPSALLRTLHHYVRDRAKTIPGFAHAPLDLVPVDHVADIVAALLVSRAGVGRPVVASSGSAAPAVRDVVDLTRRIWRTSGVTSFDPRAPAPNAAALSAIVEYLRVPRRVVLEGGITAAALGLRTPPVWQRLARTLRFYRDSAYLRRVPWAPSTPAHVTAEA